MDDFGRNGRTYRDAEAKRRRPRNGVADIIAGEFARVVAFNTAKRWSENVSEDIAQELRPRCGLKGVEPPGSLSFIEWQGPGRQITLRLV